MKLTKYHKEAFVKSVMNDVPSIDFQDEVNAAVLGDMIAQAPVKGLKVALQDKEMRPFVLSSNDSWTPDSLSVEGRYCYYNMVGICRVATYLHFTESEDLKAYGKDVMQRAGAQYLRRLELESKVAAAIAACSTVKQAAELLPEFIKYLPDEPVKGTMLPMVANMANDLIAAGWPKTKGVPA